MRASSWSSKNGPWRERHSRGTVGRDLQMSLGVATGQRTLQSAVRSGQHPDFLDFANRQPAATVSSGCQGPIIRLERKIGVRVVHAREGVAGGVRGGGCVRVHRPQRLHQGPMRSPSARRSSPAPAIRTMNARASGRRPLICCDRLRCRPRATPLRLDVNLLRGDRDHDAFALWVLSSSERAVFNSSLRMSQKGRALLHSGDGRDRTPTCDLWHVRVVVLVMPKKVEENHGIPGRNQS